MPLGQITPVILAGGSGTRLWPLSRRAMPKQFLPLIGERSTFQQTLQRVSDRTLFTRPIVITNADFRFSVQRQAAAIAAEADILLEPAARDSAAAIAAAAAYGARSTDQAILLALAADHVVSDEAAFVADCRIALETAQRERIVTFGIKPDHPATGYGYIEKGEQEGERVFRIAKFREKPSLEAAERLIAGGCLWNSGNFAFRADVMLGELQTYAPEVHAAAIAAVASSTIDLGFVRLDETSFAEAPKISIDHAVMEKTTRASVIEASFPWSDVGTWDSVLAASGPDAAGNATVGNVALHRTQGSYVRSEGALTAVIGLDDIIVISTADAVLVAAADAVHDVKGLVETLDKGGERTVREHRQSYRPWGWYQDIDRGERFRVKRIVVEPGHKLSLQKHHHRAEHWIVVRGIAEITIGQDVRTVHENQSVYIPLGEVHRLANPGRIPLELIEVQTGSYLEEDDIIRFEDVYSRS